MENKFIDLGSKTVAVSSIGLVEEYKGGTKITLNLKDETGNEIIIYDPRKYSVVSNLIYK